MRYGENDIIKGISKDLTVSQSSYALRYHHVCIQYQTKVKTRVCHRKKKHHHRTQKKTKDIYYI